MNLSCTRCRFVGSPVPPNPWGAPLRKPRKSPNVITPPTTALALHTSQDGSLLSFCARKFLTLLQQKSRFNRLGRAFQPFIVRFGYSMLAVAGVSCSEQTGEIPSVVLCYCSPSALREGGVAHSEMLFCTLWL